MVPRFRPCVPAALECPYRLLGVGSAPTTGVIIHQVLHEPVLRRGFTCMACTRAVLVTSMRADGYGKKRLTPRVRAPSGGLYLVIIKSVEHNRTGRLLKPTQKRLAARTLRPRPHQSGGAVREGHRPRADTRPDALARALQAAGSLRYGCAGKRYRQRPRRVCLTFGGVLVRPPCSARSSQRSHGRHQRPARSKPSEFEADHETTLAQFRRDLERASYSAQRARATLPRGRNLSVVTRGLEAEWESRAAGGKGCRSRACVACSNPGRVRLHLSREVPRSRSVKISTRSGPLPRQPTEIAVALLRMLLEEVILNELAQEVERSSDAARPPSFGN